MNQFALRMFVRSILAEAKDKKADDKAKDKKEAPKKSAKKEPKKTSDNLVEMKKELAAKKEALSKVEEYRDNLQAAKFAKNVSGEEFAERSGFAGELNSLSQQGIDLEKEVENTITKIKDEITALEEKTITEISRIKEMMGLTSEKKEKGQEKIVGEKLKPSMGAGAYVKDFEKSKAPQFKGKSKEKKDKMAVAAYLSAKDKK